MKLIRRRLYPLFLFAAISSPLSAVAEIPTYDEMAASNVSLMFEGFSYPGGMILNKEGKSTCNGLEFRTTKWAGSGFIVKADGTILTNFHVANKAQKGVAMFDDGARFDVGFIKAYNQTHDLATMQLSGSKKHKAVNLGNSDLARPLDPVVAVGNPKGSGLNVTDGKISQVRKDDFGKPTIISHTAPITGGNSGGALYKDKEVVGVNVSTWVGTQFHQAVPVNIAKSLLDPKYDQPVLLTNAFSPDIFKDKRELSEYFKTDGDVSAKDKDGKGGKASVTTLLRGLTDYVIEVTTDKNIDLDIVIRDSEGNAIACGGSEEGGEEIILKSMEYDEEVSIQVINNADVKAPVKLRVYTIEW